MNFLLFSSAHAQTITPASPGFDFGGYGIWVVIALAVVGIFVYLKRNPTTVSSLTNLLHKQADTHAVVVATVPQALAATPAPVDVQAQINAAVAAALAKQPAAQVAPTAAAAPVAAPVPASTAAVALPSDASKNQNGPGSPTIDGRWYKFNAGPWGNGYYVDPDPDQAAREAKERAHAQISVADMVPGRWSQAHIIAAILNSGGMSYAGPNSPGVLSFNALCAETGEPNNAGGTPPRAAKAIGDTSGSKFASALSNIRGGMTVQQAFDGQKAGVGGNYTDPEFTIDELTNAWALAQSYGVK